MAAWIGMALKRIAWPILLASAPKIIEQTTELVNALPKRHQRKEDSATSEHDLQQLQQRVNTLEAALRANAELLAQIAKQLQATTETLLILGGRLRFLMIIAFSGLAAALIGLLAVFLT